MNTRRPPHRQAPIGRIFVDKQTIPPVCQRCQQCDFVGVDYQKQCSIKRETIEKKLSRYLSRATSKVLQVHESPKKEGYRNSVKLSIQKAPYGDNFIQIGRLIDKSSHSLTDLTHCPLHPEKLNSALTGMAKIIRKSQLNLDTIHALTLRTNAFGSRFMLVWHVNEDCDIKLLKSFSKGLVKEIEQISTVVMNCQSHFETLVGKGYLEEPLAEHTLRIGAESYLPANSGQLSQMTQRLGEHIEDLAVHRLLHLYCTSGFYTVALSQKCQHITAIDNYAQNIADAERNCTLNAIDNCRFHCDEITNLATHTKNNSFDLVLLTPPAQSIKAPLIAKICQLGVKYIAYVAIDIGKFERDLRIFSENGYRLQLVEPFDTRPQTLGCDSLAILERA